MFQSTIDDGSITVIHTQNDQKGHQKLEQRAIFDPNESRKKLIIPTFVDRYNNHNMSFADSADPLGSYSSLIAVGGAPLHVLMPVSVLLLVYLPFALVLSYAVVCPHNTKYFNILPWIDIAASYS